MRVKISGVIPFTKGVEVEISDLTILVGPQASGKTVFLESLKFGIDRKHIIRRIESSPFKMNLYRQYFGSDIVLDEELVVEISPPPEESESEKVFYIPSHRALLFKDEFFKQFIDMPPYYPYVVRIFSHNLFNMMMRFKEGENVFKSSKFTEKFPYETFVNLLKEIFSTGKYHYFPKVGTLNEGTGTVGFYMQTQNEEEIIRIPAWSTGQRESFPLILGLMYSIEDENVEWVFIEEPEMGLHPRGIISILRLILIVASIYGKKIFISTHSPTIIEIFWGLRYTKSDRKALSRLIREVLEFDDEISDEITDFLEHQEVKIYYFDGGDVSDISCLDLYSGDPMASWGGILHKSSLIEDIVAECSLNRELGD